MTSWISGSKHQPCDQREQSIHKQCLKNRIAIKLIYTTIKRVDRRRRILIFVYFIINVGTLFPFM